MSVAPADFAKIADALAEAPAEVKAAVLAFCKAAASAAEAAAEPAATPAAEPAATPAAEPAGITPTAEAAGVAEAAAELIEKARTIVNNASADRRTAVRVALAKRAAVAAGSRCISELNRLDASYLKTNPTASDIFRDNSLAGYFMPWWKIYDTSVARIVCRALAEDTETAALAAEPAAMPAASPAAEPSAVPATTLAAEPAASSAAEPAAMPAASPAAEPSAMPATTLAASPAASPAAEPAASPAAEPAASPAAEPAASPTALPAAEPAALPAAKPVGFLKARLIERLANRAAASGSAADPVAAAELIEKARTIINNASVGRRTAVRVALAMRALAVAKCGGQFAGEFNALHRLYSKTNPSASDIFRENSLAAQFIVPGVGPHEMTLAAQLVWRDLAKEDTEADELVEEANKVINRFVPGLRPLARAHLVLRAKARTVRMDGGRHLPAADPTASAVESHNCHYLLAKTGDIPGLGATLDSIADDLLPESGSPQAAEALRKALSADLL